MAVSVILNDLALRDNNPKTKTLWSIYKKIDSLYDIVIRINSLEDLATHGWEIVLGRNTERITPSEGTSGNMEGVTVAVLGAYNRGKTYILSQLCGIRLPHSNLIHTEGISITGGKENYTSIVFMDTAGTDTPVANHKVGYKRATEALLREVVVHLSSFIIIVVNRLRATDQIYIDKVLEHCKNRNDQKRIIIIHNLFDVETITDVEDTIKKEVEGIFGATQDNKQFRVGGNATKTSCYSSQLYDFHLTHFIMAKSGSPAGLRWNIQSLDSIMNILQAHAEQKSSFKIISAMIEFMNTRLPQLFTVQNSSEANDSHDNDQIAQPEGQKNIEIVQHGKKPYIVLSSRKDFENLEEKPCPLDLSKRLVYDDAGYFIKNVRGFWAPRYNLYQYNDRIRLVLELPGFKERTVKFNILETMCTVQGSRDDLGLKGYVDIQASEIPIGNFKLDIPFQYPIDRKLVTIDRLEGLIIITALKKNEDGLEMTV